MRYTSKILIALVLSFSFLSFAPPEVDTNAKMRAMYVYQFTKYVDWPASSKQGNFVIGVIGNTHVYIGLEGIGAVPHSAADEAPQTQRSHLDAADRLRRPIVPTRSRAAVLLRRASEDVSASEKTGAGKKLGGKKMRTRDMRMARIG